MKDDLKYHTYLHIYITISTLTSDHCSTLWRDTPMSAVVSQNDTNKSCLVCVKSEKYACWVTLRFLWDRCHQGKAEVGILDFKTTWSEFQKASQTAFEQGEAELHILDFKTTWSEFQNPSQIAAERGKAELRILNLKTTWSEFHKPSQTNTEGGKAELCILKCFITSLDSVQSSCVH